MKLFFQLNTKRHFTVLKCTFLVFLIQSCATRHMQTGTDQPETVKDNFKDSNTAHTFYLIGDAGNSDKSDVKPVLSAFERDLNAADSSSTLLFLGDNIYPNGLPSKENKNFALAEEKLLNQLKLTKNFKGKTIFIPGNHDWNSGIAGVENQEKYVNDYLKQKKSFLPRKNCGLDDVKISDDIALITVDSQWFLEDWDDHPTINADCDIKTRKQFFDELESEINKNQAKTIIIAIHHPLLSNGAHGGQFSWRKQLFPFQANVPLPVIGSLINLIRKTSGVSPQDLQNKKYNAFVRRIKTLIQGKNNIVVVSGHDHNLQYIDQDGIKQIISGAGSKSEAARAINKPDFSYGGNGYAKLQVLKNGAAKVSYFGLDAEGKEKLLYEQQPLSAKAETKLGNFPAIAATKDTSIYTVKMTKKGGAYRFLWGQRFRKYYSTSIRARQVNLDTIYGGLTPLISGGGHQSRSLRLKDNQGREYVMRALRKSATRFLQTVAFKDQYIENEFNNTYTESFLLDFYTTSHPYTSFAVDHLSEYVGISHTNPQLFYVPKQKALGAFNAEYGNELYMIEERPTDEWKNLESFGKPDKIVGTLDVMAKLHDDEKYEIDESAYIRARIFDMLIGDWDRHQDQWRWGEYKEGKKVIYRPIPRDRDQAFTKYDGKLLGILMNIPAVRHMRKFNEDLKNVKWFNREAYDLDLALIKRSDENVWVNEARYITENLSDAEIDKSFDYLPKEVKDETIDKIKSDLKIRKTHLEKYAKEYYKVLQQTVLVVGTDKKDKFVISREGKVTNLSVFRIKKEGEELVSQHTYTSPETKEIWIYGLNDDDVYEVNGSGSKKIKVRLLGGQDKDTYNVIKGGKVKIYDFHSQENVVNKQGSARKVLSDNYETNSYDYEKPKYNVFAGYPFGGYNPDDGVKLGGVVNYTVKGFNDQPFTQRHSLGALYFFATGGFELTYKGKFPSLVGKWNLTLDAKYTSPNFTTNFFGFGNETVNPEDELDRDYNRVKIRSVKVAPAFQYIGEMGGSFKITPSFERLKLEPTENRFVTTFGALPADVFTFKNFGDINAEYSFRNSNNPSNPALGMIFTLAGGYKVNLDDSDRKFPYAESSLGFDYKLVPSGRFVLATLVKGKSVFDDNYEFYHAARLGGDLNLRGFRNDRFNGRTYFYQTSDIRWNFGKLKNGIVPLGYGIFGGYDYGRVWVKNDTSDKWHQSVGGGFWLNGVNLFTAQASYFYSTDGGRITAGLGFAF